jgi:hypothetical protein
MIRRKIARSSLFWMRDLEGKEPVPVLPNALREAMLSGMR